MYDREQDLSRLSDSQLLLRYRQEGRNEYLGVLYNRYLALVYGVCLKYLRNGDDASDAVADIFEHLLNKIYKYDVKEFRTWIYSVTKNHCLAVLNRKKKSVPFDTIENFMDCAEITHLLNEKDDERLIALLKECIEKLPEHQKISIEMFFFQDKSYADIVSEMVYSMKSVKSYLQNGKRNLKNCLEKQLK